MIVGNIILQTGAVDNRKIIKMGWKCRLFSECTSGKQDARKLLLRKSSAAAKTARLRSLASDGYAEGILL